AEGLPVLRGPSVGEASGDVADRGAGIARAPVLLADFVWQERKVRLLFARDLGAHAGHGDQELVAHPRLRCFSRGTTQVPTARATTWGGSRTRAADPSSGAITFRASNRSSRDVFPTRVSSASTSR